MEQNIKLNVLENISKVYEGADDCKLEAAFFEKMDAELTFLAEYFRVSKNQALFTSIIFTLNFKRSSIDFDDLIRYFDCSPIKILHYNDDFTALHNIGILKRRKKKHDANQDQFSINDKILDAILQNCYLPDTLKEEISDIITLLEKFYSLGQQRDDNEITTKELFSETEELIQGHLHFPLINRINQFDLKIEDSLLYLHLIWKTVSGFESIDLGRTLEGFYQKAENRIKYLMEFYTQENDLLKLKLAEIFEARFFNNTEIKLTPFSFDLLKDCGISLFKTKKKKDNIISPDDIPFKELFFCNEEMSQIFLLKELLQEPKFSDTQQRLTDKNLPKGITVLLHGLPGTGKTEIVKQLAKETGRELMKVEISQSKSMWFGESEKIIKKIFTDYNAFANVCDQTPILLFNEADAIISKRKETGDSRAGQTENAIQNILLEELENFEGILIATTNLVSNLDKAFERRFLFKIKFQKPELSIKAKIWKSKLSFLSMEQCYSLAEIFDFSGAQIENIYRKIEIYEIIQGKTAMYNDILEFCNEETLVQNKPNIGFHKI
jgi:AAA+ superfamily predicted ATPase